MAQRPDPDEVSEKLSVADAVFIHRLKGENLNWLERIPPHLPVIWASWGDDYYRVLNALNRSLFLPRTAALNALLGKMSITVQRIGNAFGGAEKRFVSACQRVDAVSTLMREEAPFFGVFATPLPKTYPSLYNPTPPESDLQWCTEDPGQGADWHECFQHQQSPRRDCPIAEGKAPCTRTFWCWFELWQPALRQVHRLSWPCVVVQLECPIRTPSQTSLQRVASHAQCAGHEQHSDTRHGRSGHGIVVRLEDCRSV